MYLHFIISSCLKCCSVFVYALQFENFFSQFFSSPFFCFKDKCAKTKGPKANFFAWKSTWVLIFYHSKSTASLHYYFLIDKKFPKKIFSWFWKTCEGYEEVPLLNPHLWKICWKFKLPYEYIFSSLWM